MHLELYDGERTLAKVSLDGVNFEATGVYQEFAVPFTYPADSNDSHWFCKCTAWVQPACGGMG